ncbi:DEAD/DEAH box helicase [Phycisphaera mikurensis]|uniref:DEAD/DEAH box helicase n=1 Tax=Phycisphaera mikurensis TaxID=547188 RepID=UPI0012B5DBA9|nr:DEAD/DEAH box helicase [Phycisphaera mikurensis]MBB6443369.1 transcription-repair coupling factor (superfamily II helicase) [Phycisphaera mikurensis]
MAVAGPTGVTTTLLAAAAALAHPGPVLLVTAFEDQAQAATADLLNLARGSDESGIGGAGDTHLVVAPFDALGPRDLLGARAEGPLVRRVVLAATLDHGATGRQDAEGLAANAGRWVIVASVAALLQAVPTEAVVAGAVRRIHPGDAVDLPALVGLLEATGHRAARAEAVAAGTFHAGGSTLRFRPLGAIATDDAGRASTAARAAVVVGFEENRIASIRFADPPTEAWNRPLAAITLATPDAKRVLQRASTRCLLDLLPARTGVVLDDAEAIALEAARLGRRAAGGGGDLTPAELDERLAARPVVRVDLQPAAEAALRLDAGRPSPFPLHADAAGRELAARSRDRRVLVVSDRPDDPRLADRLSEAPEARLMRGLLSEGFRLRGEDGFEAVPGHELLGVPAPPGAAVEDPAADGAPDSGTLGSVLVSLEPGDPLVHAEHGVALYEGMEPIEIGIGSRRTTIDHLTLAFAEPDTLRVPADQAARVFPFHAADDAPTPDPLNSRAWAKKLSAAEAAASAFVRAQRRAAAEAADRPGRAHPPEPDRLRAFEADFPFEPTPDQAEAFAAVAADLEAEIPMDRLVCGDVGFGKTEVAARAIFRVVRPRRRGGRRGHQAVLLAPTTVLAEQHGRSLAERLGPHGVSVGVLSRLRPADEQKQLKAGLAGGTLDLLIGTTALLGEGIEPDDLGLVVIDEEHRFGSGDKEALRRLRDGVDTLALTATPIPRTLHTALAGLRAVSTLRTPPAGRRAVVTEVLPAEDGRPRVRTALSRELARGGQAFVVHNRVEGLAEAAEEVRDLLGGVTRPDRSTPVVASAHGQLREEELEDALLAFTAGDTDVLVCTTIVENGLDVARAGTIVVEGADRFGLASLHQLRGRVGRSGRRGFCLLEVPKNARLSEGAQKRLAAMEDADGLGAGFAIAEADLALRGAGDLLGDEQSGHVAAVGHALYSRLLQRAAREQAGDLRPAPERTGHALPNTGNLPAAWIPPSLPRLNAYRWLTHVDDEDQLGVAVAHLTRTWGEPPEQARRFVAGVRLRLAMADAGVLHAAKSKKGITLTLALPPARDEHEAHRGSAVEQLNANLDKPRFRAGVGADELLYTPPPEVEDAGLVEHLTGVLAGGAS